MSWISLSASIVPVQRSTSSTTTDRERFFPATRSMPLTTSRDRVSEGFTFVFHTTDILPSENRDTATNQPKHLSDRKEPLADGGTERRAGQARNRFDTVHNDIFSNGKTSVSGAEIFLAGAGCNFRFAVGEGFCWRTAPRVYLTFMKAPLFGTANPGAWRWMPSRPPLSLVCACCMATSC
jgi:hypothetical protein